VKVENPAAFRFVLEDELYLLNADKLLYDKVAEPEPTAAVAPSPVVENTKPETVAASPSLTPEPQSVIKTPVADFKYMGKNLKSFLVLTHYNATEFIKADHLTALENILKRKELGPDDVAIFNLANYSETKFSQLKTFFKPTKVLVLGGDALPQDIKVLKLNKPVTSNGITVLYSFSFEEMMDSVDYKKAFWEQVKTL
jgi:DNA polymerase III psi subunit